MTCKIVFFPITKRNSLSQLGLLLFWSSCRAVFTGSEKTKIRQNFDRILLLEFKLCPNGRFWAAKSLERKLTNIISFIFHFGNTVGTRRNYTFFEVDWSKVDPFFRRKQNKNLPWSSGWNLIWIVTFESLYHML